MASYRCTVEESKPSFQINILRKGYLPVTAQIRICLQPVHVNASNVFPLKTTLGYLPFTI